MWNQVKCPECGDRYTAGGGAAFERPLCVCVFEEVRKTVVLQAGAPRPETRTLEVGA
jgi:hypothetical protein